MVSIIRMEGVSGYGNSVEGKTTSAECIREGFLEEVAIALGLHIQMNES